MPSWEPSFGTSSSVIGIVNFHRKVKEKIPKYKDFFYEERANDLGVFFERSRHWESKPLSQLLQIRFLIISMSFQAFRNTKRNIDCVFVAAAHVRKFSFQRTSYARGYHHKTLKLAFSRRSPSASNIFIKICWWHWITHQLQTLKRRKMASKISSWW